jgi:hypothetical protein
MAKQRAYVKKFIKKQAQNAGEPELKDDMSSTEMSRILNWYNSADYTDRKKKTWVIEYAKENGYDFKALGSVPEKFFTGTLTTVCRLANRGYTDKSSLRFIEKNMPILIARDPKIKVKEEVVVSNKPTIQDRMKEQVKSLLAEVDYAVDCKVTKGNDNAIVDLLIEKNTGGPQTKLVIAHVEKYIAEFQEVKLARLEDKELFKAYGMTPKVVNAILKYLVALKADLENYLGAKKKLRKVSTRTKKVKSPAELTNSAKYDANSILKPKAIIGSGYVVLYNSKYNTLAFLNSEDSGGMTVRGTSVTGFDEKKSQMFKPKRSADVAKLLKEISTKTGVRALKNFMKDETKLKETKARLTGRLSDTVNIVAAV